MNAAAPTLEPVSARAVISLVLGVVGLSICILAAPVAWLLGHWELQDIERGGAPPSGRGLARAGMVLGLIGSVPLALVAALLLACVPVLMFVLIFAA